MAGKKAKPFDPVATADLDLPEVAALQAVAKGTALPHQQQLAVKVMVEKICRRYEFPYCPGGDGDRDTLIALGRMRAGIMLTSFINADLKNFRGPEDRVREQG